MEKIIIASNNQGKIIEFKNLLGNQFNAVSMMEYGIEIDIAETGTSFVENAIIKAQIIYQQTNCAVIADDSGLCIDALGGLPGIKSARFVSDHDNETNIMGVLDKMKKYTNRNAQFVCAIAYINKSGKLITAQGETKGHIAYKKIGENGFGYDSIFIADELGITFAQATFEQKQMTSHRVKALQNLIVQL